MAMRGGNLKIEKSWTGLARRAQRLPPQMHCSLLVVGCLLLHLGLRIGCWSLVVGRWLLAAGRRSCCCCCCC